MSWVLLHLVLQYIHPQLFSGIFLSTSNIFNSCRNCHGFLKCVIWTVARERELSLLELLAKIRNNSEKVEMFQIEYVEKMFVFCKKLFE